MTTLTIFIRVVQLVASVCLVGVFAFLLAVARPAFNMGGSATWVAFRRFDCLLLRLGRWSLLGLFGFGIFGLWVQLATVTGRPLFQALMLEDLRRILIGTHYGHVWLIRLVLMGLLGGLLWLREHKRDGRDWWTRRLEYAGLAGGLLVAHVWSGHAAAAEGITLALLVVVDALHLLAAGIWLGSLPLLAALLTWAGRAEDPGAAMIAAHATCRFSALGLASVGILVVTGLANAWALVGNFPALVGTPYGRLLLLKVCLLLPLLVLAALNLLREKPRLLVFTQSQEQAKGQQILWRLRRNVLGEAALGGCILLLAGGLAVMPPAFHIEPTWPFPFRLSWQAAKDLPGVRGQLAIGIPLAMLGFLAALAAVIKRMRHWPWIAIAGIVTMAVWLTVSLEKFAVDAHPTTYLRSTVPYQAFSIANGLRLYQEHCAFCHGMAGYGDGPAAAVLRPRPADLTAKHTADHTVGDMFWWLTHGKKGTSMPAFQDRLGAEERWDLINLIRTLAAAEQARGLGPLVAPDPWLVAPDFVYTTMAGENRALKDLRGQDIVLLVFFSLPDSHGRLAQLHGLYVRLRRMRVEILGVPLRTGRAMDWQLADPGVGFPIVYDGADEAAAAYTLFLRSFTPEGTQPDPPMPSHLEFLIDRQGYIRARWSAWDGPGWSDAERLVAAIDQLNEEKPRAPAPDEHVH